ncbi:MAG TPA: carboxypeptidase regulatory-like domain-containing protein [Bryobacteraceae bacterium]|nr:carboxypeptidase regulatory-like domain-containing protein [Bryobacteraceae bacterium]
MFAKVVGCFGAANRSAITTLFLLTLGVAVLTAQDYRGRVQGTVKDTTDAVIPGANVTLSNVNTGISTVRTTNESGHYIFDLVEPGSYRISVESAGFTKFLQENVPVAARGDVTVDAVLKAGDVHETVTVAAEASQVQLTTSKLETSVDAKIAQDIPQLYRSPFVLATLDPSVLKNDGNSEYNPFNSWGPNNLSIGGGASYSNDLQVDGSRVGISVKTGYVPTPDMVQEITISQNTVDAEFGHGSGSSVSIVTKSGTNQWHGTAYYNGRYPWADAVSDRIFRTLNEDRQQIYGGTLGNPILKNKLFNFVSYEGWKWAQAASPYTATLPTSLERQGNFSQSVNGSGGMDVIYDPWSTVTSANGQTITRTPFPGNIIPGTRQDPIAAKYMSALWQPNGPGQGYDHLWNYVASLPVNYPYKNFADRVDYHVNNNLNLSFRAQIFRTPVTSSNPTGSPLFDNDRGSNRDGNTYSGTVTYALGAKTVITGSVDYHDFTDQSSFGAQPAAWTFASLYPSNNFYQALYTDPTITKLDARMSISGDGGRWVDMGPGGGFWNQLPSGNGVNIKIARQEAAHYLKAGFETLGTHAPSLLQLSNPGFGFNGDITNATYVNPNIAVAGNPYASFLLGAVVPIGASSSGWDSNETSMPSLVTPNFSSRFYGVYVNDDWKISKNLTLNLGLRWEYEQPFTEEQNRATAPLDLTTAIPELQGLQMPAAVKQFYSGPWILNGAFQFTSSSHPGAWNADSGTWSPRAGFAYRLGDKMSLRAGYGRYVTPWSMDENAQDQFGPPTTGYSNYTDAPPTVLGVPQMSLSNPFPSTFPIQPSIGKKYGTYTGIGGDLTFFNPNRPHSFSNRVNVSIQRQLPQGIIGDVTYFFNRTGQINNVNYNINQVDPRIALQYGAATNATIANPFYNLAIPNSSPGPLWNEATIPVTQLARLYPQYGNLTEIDGISGGSMTYHSLQMKATKSFSSGYTMLVAYSYHVQSNRTFYDGVDNYLKQWTWEDSGTPRHRLVASGTWAIPLGKGRRCLPDASRLLDALVGGWNLAGVVTWHTGDLLQFPGMLVNGSPYVSNPGPNAWFNTAAFSLLPAYTRATNPWYYSGIRGPQFFNIDAALNKEFSITERIRFQLHMDAFNALNNMNWNDPNMTVGSSQFGKSTDIYPQDYGRRLQLGLRLSF